MPQLNMAKDRNCTITIKSQLCNIIIHVYNYTWLLVTAILSFLSLFHLLQSLTFIGKKTTSLKFKEKATDLDTRSYKCLLLALVKLIHADPKLMLHVSPSTFMLDCLIS